jgi:hypothetical protein
MRGCSETECGLGAAATRPALGAPAFEFSDSKRQAGTPVDQTAWQ